MAAAIVPRHSPKPMVAKPSRAQRARSDAAVAVFEERARLAGGEFNRPSPAGRDREQAAEPAVPGRRDRAGAEQIARAQIAAAAAVMSHKLGHGPVEMACVADG